MTYIPTDWKNRVVDDDGNVLQEGTPLSADNLMKIENKLVSLDEESHIHENQTVLDSITQEHLELIEEHSLQLTEHEEKIMLLMSSITNLKVRVVGTITERDALENKEGIVHVINATDDETVSSGWAQYIYQTDHWLKIAESESLDIILSWGNILEKPSKFPPTDHKHTEADITDLDKYSKSEVDTKLNEKSNVDHKHTEADIVDLDKYTKTEIDAFLSEKASIVLASASNDGLMSATDYSNLAEAIQTIATLVSHMNNKENPHVVTKSQVGLNNVQNYAVASQAQAEAGTSNSLYMTPIRVKQAIAKNVPNVLSGFENDSGFISSNATKITVSNTAPTNPSVNDIWIKT